MASGQPFKRLSLSFRMGKTTVANIVYGTCKAIWKNLVHLHMPKPTEELLKNITEKYYEKWQFPNCVGAIDGKHCRIKNPKFAGSSHYNYKHFFSMHLQAVADADKRFICIEVGGRGKQSDAGTFHYSNLNRLLQSNNYNIPGPQYLPTSDIVLPMVFIGDEGYPLKTYLMRPYPQSVLNAQNELFNKRLSRARKTIECAFGILRSKWHIFRSPIETNKCHARLLIKTCCLLHNIIRDKDGDNDIAYITVNTNQQTLQTRLQTNARASYQAQYIREKFKEYFVNNPISY